MRIAIASSGLGHVARGIETWAEDTARALWELGMRNSECGTQKAADGRGEIAGSDVIHGDRGLSVFGAERVSVPDGIVTDSAPGSPDSHSGPCDIEVTLFAAGSLNETCPASRIPRPPCDIPRIVVLPCLRRSSRMARLLAQVSPGFTWRWGFKSAYGWEQFTFWRRLEPELRRGEFDILHVQDPMLVFWCRRARKTGRLRTQEILAHGTEESPEFLSQFEYVQHLTPWHLREAREFLTETQRSQRGKVDSAPL